MKKIIFLIGVLLLVVITASYSKSKPQTNFKVISIKKNTVYFKVNKSFIGGVVEVYNANNQCMDGEDLPHTHTMIYFDDAPKGFYTIRVKKGDLCMEFKYHNM